MKYLYIAGKWTDAADGGTSQTINPYDATVLDTLAEAGPADVDAAVAAAREAFDEGPRRRSTLTDRTALLGKIADLLQRDREQLGLGPRRIRESHPRQPPCQRGPRAAH